jgi:hypothetical protein
MRPLKALGLLLVACIISMGSAEVLVHPAEARGRMDSPGGPDEHSGQDMTAKSITLSQASGVALYAGSTTDVFASFAGNVAGGSNGTMRYNTTNGWEMYGVGIYAAGRIHSASTTSVGSITLSAGSGTATTFSGAKCVCTDTTANASVKCAVSGTTLTATGTTTDVIAYVCL